MGRGRRKMGLWRDFIDGWNDDLRYEQMKPRVFPPRQRPLSDPRWLQTTRGKGFLIFVFVGMSAMVTMPLWPDRDMAALISMIPVFLMNSGRSNGGFSIPRLPCKYFRLKHQCLGTGTVFLMDLRCTNNPGSLAVTSCISTTSGLVTSCFNSATDNRLSFFNFRLPM